MGGQGVDNRMVEALMGVNNVIGLAISDQKPELLADVPVGPVGEREVNPVNRNAVEHLKRQGFGDALLG